MLPAFLGSLALMYRGLKPDAVVPRPVGHGEKPMVEPPASDPAWPFRGSGLQNDLTEAPVRVSENSSTPVRKPRSKEQLELDVLVVGGGAGGLASAASLKRRGVHNLLVVEKNEKSGDIWRSRYHRLHLHDVAEECSLPGLAIRRVP